MLFAGILHSNRDFANLNRDRSLFRNEVYCTLTCTLPSNRIIPRHAHHQSALYLDWQKARHASLITASGALSRRGIFSFPASICSATFSNFIAGPLGVIAREP